MTDEQPPPSAPGNSHPLSFDLVADLLGGEKAVQIGIEHQPIYEVPGRRPDGTVWKPGRAAAAGHWVNRAIRILENLFIPDTHFYVRGPATAKAIPAAEAVVNDKAGAYGTPRFVYSEKYAAVIRPLGTTRKPSNALVLWWAGPGERPSVTHENWRRVTITWDDGSTISFDTTPSERRRLQEAAR